MQVDDTHSLLWGFTFGARLFASAIGSYLGLLEGYAWIRSKSRLGAGRRCEIAKMKKGRWWNWGNCSRKKTCRWKWGLCCRWWGFRMAHSAPPPSRVLGQTCRVARAHSHNHRAHPSTSPHARLNRPLNGLFYFFLKKAPTSGVVILTPLNMSQHMVDYYIGSVLSTPGFYFLEIFSLGIFDPATI